MEREKLYTVSEDGEMLIEGRRVSDLVERYGTPLIVYSERELIRRCREYTETLKEYYPRGAVYYAGKAFLTTGFCRFLQREGLGLDVVSSGEYFTALKAGFDPKKVIMHGNAKPKGELKFAVETGIGRIVIDNFADIDKLGEIVGEVNSGDPVEVMIRVTPGVKPSTHRYIQTGQVDSKFGFNLDDRSALAAAREVAKLSGLRLVGLHCHIGSQIFDLKPYELAVEAVLEFYAELKKDGIAPALDELNMGGGLAISYADDEIPPSIGEHIKSLSEAVLRHSERLGLKPPFLYDEPGRSIVGPAAITLYHIESVKKIPGVRNYLSVNGGMTDNPRYALYQVQHEILAAGKMRESKDTVWTVSGRCCESGDLLGEDVSLPEMVPGDILAVTDTGAYNYSMASHYNRVGKPAVVLLGVRDGEEGLLAERESLEELAALDRIPDWL